MRPVMFAVLLAVLSAPLRASMVSAQGDGLYGRLQTDFVVSAYVWSGAAEDSERQLKSPLVLGAGAALRYLDSAGLVIGVESLGIEAPRLLIGAELRPVFLAFFFKDKSSGKQWSDLTLGSLGLEISAAVDTRESLSPGISFALSVEPPIYWNDGDGLVLRCAVRYVHSAAGESLVTTPSSTWLLELGLGWRSLVELGTR